MLYTNNKKDVLHTYLASNPYATVTFGDVLLIEVEAPATEENEEDTPAVEEEEDENQEPAAPSVTYTENNDTQINGTESIMLRGVKKVLTGAFNGNDFVKEIGINAVLTEIGDGAFSLTTSLIDIIVSNDNEHYVFDKSIGALFNKDRSLLHTYLYSNTADSVILQNVNITSANGLTHIGARAFEGTKASRVRLPDSIVYVGDYAFKDMQNLKYLYFESSPETEALGINVMGDMDDIKVGRKILVYGPGGADRASTIDEYRYSTVQNYFIDNYYEKDDVTTRVRYIAWTEDDAFNYDLNKLSDGKGTATITSMKADLAYDYGYGYKEIVVAPYVKIDGVKYNITKIGQNAFKDRVEIKALTLLYSVEEIEEGFVKGAYNIEDIFINDNDNYIVLQNDATYACGIVYTSDMKTLMAYMPMNAPRIVGASYTDFSVPQSVTRIAAGAFAGSKHLTKIRVGGGVAEIGAGAFADCEWLNDIIISSSNVSYRFDSYTLYSYDMKLLHTYLATGGGNNGVGVYVVPDGVTEIAAYAFEGNDRLEYIRIPEYPIETGVISATIVGAGAFADMNSLKEIFFENLVEIGVDAKELAGNEITGEDRVNNEIEPADGARVSSIKATTSLYHYTYTELTDVTADNFDSSVKYYKIAGQYELAEAYDKDIVYYSREVSTEEIFVGKNSFKWGEEFVAVGLNIYALYEGGGSHLLEEDEYTFDASAYNKYAAGSYKIVVSLLSNPNLTTSFNVTVEPVKDIFGEMVEGNFVTVYAPQSSYLNHAAEMQTNVRYVPYTPKQCLDLTLTEDGYVVNGFNTKEDPCVLTAIDYVGDTFVQKGDHSMLTVPSYINNTPVYKIADNAFKGSALVSVKVLEGVEIIGVSAFEKSAALKSIELSSTVNEIGAGAFLYLDALEEFVLIDNGYFHLTGGALYGDSGALLHTMFNAFATEIFETEEPVRVVEDRAFEGVATIRYLTVPYTTYHVGDSAFKNMADLEEIYFCTDMDTDVEHGYIAPNALSGCMEGLTLFGPKGVYLESFANRSGVIYVAWNDDSCFDYVYVNGTIEILKLNASGHDGCSGDHVNVVVPMYIGGVKVTSIGVYAFKGEEKIVSLVIPTSVTNIGTRAFEACTSLAYITVPYSVKTIGDSAFAACSSLDEVVFNTDSLTIGNDAFISAKTTLILYSEKKSGVVSSYASRYGISFNTGTPYTCFLTSTLVNASGVSYIRVDGLKNHKCKYEHKTVVIPNYLRGKKVLQIKSGAFAGNTTITSLTLSDFVSDVGTGTFNGCTSLSEVAISPANVNVKIDSGLIYTADGKTLLAIVDSIAGTNVTLADGTETVQANALYGSALQTLALNDELTFIGSGAFGGADNLSSITVNDGNKKFASEDGILYNKSKTALIAYPAGLTDECYIVKDGVIVIGSGAFGGAKYLKSVVLPASVSSISQNAFYGAEQIIDIQVNGPISSVDTGAFGATNEKLVVTGLSEGALEIFCTENGVRFMEITPATCFSYTTDGMTAGTAKITGLQPHTCTHHVNVVVPMYIGGLRVTAIGDRAFAHQQKIQSIVIPQTVMNVGVAAFAGCKNLTSVYLGDSVSYISSKTFTSTESLTEIFITSPEFKVSNDAFYNAGYEDLTVYLDDNDSLNEVKEIILESGARTATIEDIVCLRYSVVNGNEIKIAGIASHVCPNGHNGIVIPGTIDGKTVTAIADGAFAGNNTVVKIYLPETIRKIGDSAFKGASKLYDIAFYHYEGTKFVETDSNAYFAMDGGALYSSDFKTLYAYMTARSEVEMNVNRNTRYVKSNAFFNATNLLSITFLEDLYESGIAIAALTGVNQNLIVYTPSTTSKVYLALSAGSPANYQLKAATEATGFAYQYLDDEDNTVAILGLTAAFKLSHLFDASDTLVIPQFINGRRVSTIAKNAFAGLEFGAVVFPDGLIRIGEMAFANCVNLSNVIFPSSLETVEKMAFSGCSNMFEAYFLGAATSLGESIFNNTMSVALGAKRNFTAFGPTTTYMTEYFEENGVDYNTCASVLCFNYEVQQGNFIYIDSIKDHVCNSNHKVIHVPDKIDGKSVIGINAAKMFVGLSTVESVTLPDDMERIEDGLFKNCSSLVSVNVPSGLNYIGANAFENCVSLEKIVFPSSLTRIGNYAFKNCHGLTDVVVPTDCQSLGEGAFYGCSGLERIMLPRQITTINDYLFNECSRLNTLSYVDATGVVNYGLSKDVVSIGKYSFYGCSSLQNVFVGVYGSLTSLGEKAFAYSALSEFELSKKITTLGDGVFAGCTSLDIKDGGNATYSLDDSGGIIYLSETIKAVAESGSEQNDTTFSITNGALNYFFGEVSIDAYGSVVAHSDNVTGKGDSDGNHGNRLNIPETHGEWDPYTSAWVSYSYSSSNGKSGTLSGSTIKTHFDLGVGPYAAWKDTGKEYYGALGGGDYTIIFTVTIAHKQKYDDGWLTKSKTYYYDYSYVITFTVNDITSVWYYNVPSDEGGEDISATVNAIVTNADSSAPQGAIALGAKYGAGDYFTNGDDPLFDFDYITDDGEVTINIKDAPVFAAMSGYLIVHFEVSGLPSTTKSFELSKVAKTEFTQYTTIHTVLASMTGKMVLECDDELSVVIKNEEDCVLGAAIDKGEENANLLTYQSAYVKVMSGTTQLFTNTYAAARSSNILNLPDAAVAGKFQVEYNLSAIKKLTGAGASATVTFYSDDTYETAFSTVVFNIARPSVNNGYFVKVTATYNNVTIYGEKKDKTYVFKNNDLAAAIAEANLPGPLLAIRSVTEFALEGCSELDSLSIGEGVDTIGAGALINTQGIAEIGVNEQNDYFVLYKIDPNDPTYAYSGGGLYKKLAGNKLALIAFLGSNTVTEFTLPDNCTEIGDYAFSHNTTIQKVDLNNVTKIGKKAFYGCTALKYMTLPAGGAASGYKYGDRAFEGAGIESVYFDGDFQYVGQLGEMMFGENYDVTVYAKYDSGRIAEYFADYYGHTIRVVKTTDISFFAYETINGNEIKIKKYVGSDKEVIVPDMIENKKVTVIGDAAFEGTSVVTVKLPSYITLIGDYAFSDATSLAELYVNSDPTIKQNLFNNHNSSLIVYGITASELDDYCESIGVTFNLGTTWGCFTYSEDSTVTITGLNQHECNSSHKHLIIPNYINGKLVTEIAADAFNAIKKDVSVRDEYRAIESVTIPASVTTIGAGAFANNPSLKVLRFQNTTMESIGASYYDETNDCQCNTFGDNTALVVYASEMDSTIVKMFCQNEGIEYHAVATLDDIEYEEINGSYVVTGISITGSGNVILPDMIYGKKITEIAKFAFQSKEYASVTLGKYVTKIGEHAFDSCTNLKVVSLPDGLKTIGELAFNECTALTALFIPSSVNEIGDMAFAGCTALRTLRFLGDVKTIGNNVLMGITMTYGSTSANAPKSVSFLQVRKDATNLYNYFWTKCNVRATRVEDISVYRRWEECYEYNVLMDEYDELYVEIIGLKDHICANGGHGDIYIPESIGGIVVRSVADKAFAGVTTIRSASFESTGLGGLVTLGNRAFSGCSLLGEVDLGPVQIIGDGAFENCALLSKITTKGSSISAISDNGSLGMAGVFAGCVNLKEIAGLTGLKGLLASNGVIYRSTGAAWEAKYVYDLTGEVLNLDKATSIDSNAFNSVDTSAVKIINIPETLSSMPYAMLTRFTNLEEVNVAGADGTFNLTGTGSLGTGVTVYIPSGKSTNIGSYVEINNPAHFDYTAVKEGETIVGVEIKANDDFNATTLTLPHYGYVDGVCYPVIGIADNGFEGKAIETINALHVSYIGKEAFKNCTSLVTARLYEGKVDVLEEIKEDAFSGCTELKYVYLGKSLTVIDGNPFGSCRIDKKAGAVFAIDPDNTRYTSKVDGVNVNMILSKDAVTLYASYATGDVVVPDGVVKILSGAFKGKDITSITIPTSVRMIAKDAIVNCSDLTSLTILSENLTVGEFQKGSGGAGIVTRSQCASSFTVFAVEGTIVEDYANWNNIPFRAVVSTNAITFAGGVITKVNTDMLGKVLIVPTNYYEGTALVPVTKIAANAFYGAKQVDEIYLSYHLAEIGSAAFAGMTSLKKVIFMDDGPAAFSSLIIGKNAFAYSYSLSEVHFESYTTNMTVDSTAFRASGSNLTVYAPNLSNELTKLRALQGVVATCEVSYSRCLATQDLNANETILTGVNPVYALDTSVNGTTYKKNTYYYKDAGVYVLSESDTYDSGKLYYKQVGLTNKLLIPEYINGRKVVGVNIGTPSSLTGFTGLFLPDTITYIAAGSFSDTNVTEVVIPDGVQTIDDGAFCAKYADLHVYYDGDAIDANVFANANYTVYLHTGATVTHLSDGVEKVAVSPASYFTYEVVRGREVVITGLTNAGKSEKEIVLPTYLKGRKVTKIGDGAFAHNSTLEKLTISKYVSEIGNNVFVGTFENVKNAATEFLLFETGNESFEISQPGPEQAKEDILILRDAGPEDAYTTIYAVFSVLETPDGEDSVVFTFSVADSVTEIKEGAFAGAYSLRKIYGNAYFRGESDNTALVKVGDGEGANSVLITVLRTCSKFEIATSDVYRVGAYAFYGCTLSKIISIPETVSELGEGAFENSKALSTISLPGGISYLPARLFYGCSSLTGVSIPNGVNSIGAFAFGKSALKSIDFTALDLLTTIGDSAFAYCEELTSISFVGTNVTAIGKDAFRGCSKLGSIDLFTVKDEETNAMSSALAEIGAGAFAGTAITEIILPDNVMAISDSLFEDATLLRSVIAKGTVTSVGKYAFKGATSLTAIPETILPTLTFIGEGAFMESGLQEVSLPQGVTEIAPATFKDCKYLTSVTLTSSLKKIGNSAFEGCDGRIGLNEYTYVAVSGGKVTLVDDTDAEDVKTVSVKTTTVSGNVYSTVVNGHKIRAVGDKIVVDNRFSGTAYEDEVTGEIYRVAIVDDLKIDLRKIGGEYVLRIMLDDGGRMNGVKLSKSFGITKINLGIRVSEIGKRAFANTAIESVNLTDSVVTVGDEAFAYNDSLQSVLIGMRLETIGSGVFRGTPNLSGVDVNKKNTHFKSDDDKVLYMYDETQNGWILKLYPAGRVPAGDLAFVIPAEVVGVDEGAFDGCKLESVIVQDGVKSIAKGAFNNAGSLKTVFFDADLAISADVFNKYNEETQEEERISVELDVPMYGTLATFCEEYFSTGNVTYKLHTPKSCFKYETNETTVKITGIKGDCTHSHEVLVVPDYIDGRRVTKIGDLAFANAGIVNLKLPRLLDEIGDGAFYGNELATITMDGTVTEDAGEEKTSNGTFEIEKIYYEEELQYTTLTNVQSDVLIAYIGGVSVDYTLPDDVHTVGYGAFYKANVTEVDLTSAYRIETAAFFESELSSAEGLENVTWIGDSAFENTAVTTFTFGADLAHVGSAAFAGTNVTSITFGDVTDNGFYRYENNLLYEYGDGKMTNSMTLHTVFNAYVEDATNAGDFLTVPDSFTVEGDGEPVEYVLAIIGAYAFKSLDVSGHNGIVIIPSVARNLTLAEGAFLNDTIDEVHFESRVDAEADEDKFYFDEDAFVYYPQGSDLTASLVASHHGKYLAFTPKESLDYVSEENDTVVRVKGAKGVVNDLVIPVYIDAKLVTAVGNDKGASGFSSGRIVNLVVTDRVTSLAANAFNGCTTLRDAKLGEGITVIPDGLFEGCTLLKTVTMSSEVTTIGAAAFKSTILTAIPVVVNGGTANVIEIGDSAFEGVRSLTEIKFWGTPTGKLTVGNNAFKDCNNSAITMIDVPAWVKLGTGVFYSKSNSLSYLLFEGDQWETSTNVTALALDALDDMTKCFINLSSPYFTKVSVSMSATRLRKYFTILGNYKKVTLTSETYQANKYYVYNATSKDLEQEGVSAEFDADKTYYENVENATIMGKWSCFTPDECFEWAEESGTGNVIVKGLKASVLNGSDATLKGYITDAQYGNGALLIPEYYEGKPVRIIGNNLQFGANDFITKVVIPDSVTKIAANAFYGFNAANITVVFGDNTQITEIDTHAFKEVDVKQIVIKGKNPLTIGEEAFIGTSLTTLTISNANTIGTKAFYGIGIKTVDLIFTGDNATIGEYAFAFASNGNTIAGAALAVKGTISEIKAHAFENNDVGVWAFDAKATTIGDYAFSYAKVTAVPVNVETIGDYAYLGASIRKNGVGNVVVTDVVSVGKGAFSGSDITGFCFGSELATFYSDNADNEGSLHDTKDLVAITYGDKDVSNPWFGVKKNVMYTKDEENNRYVAIKFAEKANGEVGDFSILTEIGYGAFRGSLFTKGKFDVVAIGDYAFAGCTSLVSVNNTKSGGAMFGSGLNAIGKGAFEGCTAIKKIELQGLTSLTIGEDAFKTCSALVEVYLSASQIAIGSNAFAVDNPVTTESVEKISLATLDSANITIADGYTFTATVIFVPKYSTEQATAINSKLTADHKIFYTPTECLSVNENGAFCGGSAGCSLHEDHKHGTIILPLYKSYLVKITGVYADENKLLDGDATTELTSVDYVYGYTYVYVDANGDYKTATLADLSGDKPAYVHGTAIGSAAAVIGL